MKATIMSTMSILRGLLPALLLGAFFIGCSDSNPATPAYGENSDQMSMGADVLTDGIAAIQPGVISPEERASLIFMREEEKLARDVYVTMYQRWGRRTFKNISRSEETHMRAVLTLLNRYSIPDPIGANGIGEFTNSTLQDLYNQLVAQGNGSLVEALRVGVLIEETDIRDLKAGLLENDNEDIIFVYNNLLRGSQNHLRAFNQNLGMN